MVSPMLRIHAEGSEQQEDKEDAVIALTCATLNPTLRRTFYSLLPRFRQDKLLIRSIGATVSFARLGRDTCVFFNLNGDLTQGNFHQVYLQMSKGMVYLLEMKDERSLILDRDYLHQQLLIPEITQRTIPILVLVIVHDHFSLSQKQKIITTLNLPMTNDLPWAVFPIHLHNKPKKDLEHAFTWLRKALTFTSHIRDLKQFQRTPFHELLLSILPNARLQMNPLFFHRFLEVSFREFDIIASDILHRVLKDAHDGDLTLTNFMPREFFTEELMTAAIQNEEAREHVVRQLTEPQKELKAFIRQQNDPSFIEHVVKKLSMGLKEHLQQSVLSNDLDGEIRWYSDMINQQIGPHVPFLRFFLVQEFLPHIFFDHFLTPNALRERLLKRWFQLPVIKQARRLYSELSVVELLLRMLLENHPNWIPHADIGQFLALKTTLNKHEIIIFVSFGELGPELRVQVACSQKKVRARNEKKTFAFTPCIVPEHQIKILYSSENMVIKDYLLLVAKINLLLTYFAAINLDAPITTIMTANELIHEDIIEQFVHAFGKCPHFNWSLNV